MRSPASSPTASPTPVPSPAPSPKGSPVSGAPLGPAPSAALSPEQRDVLQELARRSPGFTMGDAAARLGVSRATLYRAFPRRCDLLAALGVARDDDDAPERILVALEEVLLSGGVAGVSVEAVAARAGFSTATVYRHFPDRAALWRALMAKKSVRTSAHRHLVPVDPAGADGGGDDPVDALAAFTLEALVRLHQGRALFEVMLATPPALRRELGALRDADRGTAESLAAYLRAQRARGAVADDVDVDVVAGAFVGQLLGLAVLFPMLGVERAHTGEEPQAPRDPVAVARTLARTLWRGVRA